MQAKTAGPLQGEFIALAGRAGEEVKDGNYCELAKRNSGRNRRASRTSETASE